MERKVIKISNKFLCIKFGFPAQEVECVQMERTGADDKEPNRTSSQLRVWIFTKQLYTGTSKSVSTWQVAWSTQTSRKQINSWAKPGGKSPLPQYQCDAEVSKALEISLKSHVVWEHTEAGWQMHVSACTHGMSGAGFQRFSVTNCSLCYHHSTVMILQNSNTLFTDCWKLDLLIALLSIAKRSGGWGWPTSFHKQMVLQQRKVKKLC